MDRYRGFGVSQGSVSQGLRPLGKGIGMGAVVQWTLFRSPEYRDANDPSFISLVETVSVVRSVEVNTCGLLTGHIPAKTAAEKVSFGVR